MHHARDRSEDAISMLESEHAAARGLLAMLHRPLSPRARERAVFVLIDDLRIHVQLEAEILYPAFAARSDAAHGAPGLRNAVREALGDLERFSARGSDVLPVARRLLALHDEHAAEEERHVFPFARRVLGQPALVALGERLRARRRELRETGPVPRGPATSY